MTRDKTWRWQFFGFESRVEGRPVQAWFDNLPQDDQDEIMDLLATVQVTTACPWPEWVFDPLNGEGGISEIKVPEIRCFRDGEVRVISYRIYGWFGPEKHSYTFLHGTDKEMKNDKTGKQIAKVRLVELRQRNAGVHRFVFEEKSNSEAEEKPRRPN